MKLIGFILPSMLFASFCFERISFISLSENVLMIPGGEEKLQEELLPLYENQPFSTELLDCLKIAVQAYFEKNGYPFVTVSVPEQRIDRGSLELAIEQGRLGRVCVQGSKYTSPQLLTGYLDDLRSGCLLNLHRLRSQIEFLNRNPFRRVDALFSAGEEMGTTDLTLLVEERSPIRIYAGTDNTGIPTTQRERFFAGFDCGRLWGLDQIFSYQFTSSYNVQAFLSHTVQYTLLFPSHTLLTLYGGYSQVQADLDSSVLSGKAQSGQASFRYIIPVPVLVHFSGELGLGMDYKLSDNAIEFTGFAINNETGFVNLAQFAIAYRFYLRYPTSTWSVNQELFWSPGIWLTHQKKEDFNEVRPGALPYWIYYRLALSYAEQLPKKWLLTATFRGQASSEKLIPSEQLGIGGYDTVRGYNERELNADFGLIGNIELRTPPLGVLSLARRKGHPDALQFLAFFDIGHGWQNTPTPDVSSSETLMGAGPGVRYTLDPYITVRCDLGFRLLHAEDRFSQLHFSAILSY